MARTGRTLASASMLALAVALPACSSLAQQVRSSAIDYSSVMESFTNEVLVANVIRARDQSPLNFADLPIIHGSISQQSSLGAVALLDGRTGTTLRNTVAPAVQFSSSPTFDTSSLNNEAFVLNMLQPISPVFIESLWHTGISKRLLLNLFAESIRLPAGAGDAEAPVYGNDPEAADPQAYRDFQRVVDALVDADADLRSFTVLDPLGPPLLSDAGRMGGKPFVNASMANDRLYSTIFALDPATYQVGAVSGTGRLDGRETDVAGFQVYRRNTAQIGLCVDAALLAAAARQAVPESGGRLAGRLIAAARELGEATHRNAHTAVALYVGRSSGGQSSPSTRAPDGASHAGGLRTESGKAYPATGMLDSRRDCRAEEHVSPAGADENDIDASRLGRIRWRSPLDIYGYLGALLRHAQDPDRTPAWTDARNGSRHYVFRLERGVPAPAPGRSSVMVRYGGDIYAVVGQTATAPGGTVIHSLQVLSLLGQFVSASKISSQIPVTRSIEVLP